MRAISGVNPIESIGSSRLRNMSPTERYEVTHRNFQAAFTALARAYFFLFQGSSTELLVPKTLSTKSFFQTTPFPPEAGSGPIVPKKKTAPEVAEGKPFFIKPVGSGDTRFIPFTEFDKRRAVDSKLIVVQLHPRWMLLSDNASKKAIFLVFQRMLADIVMWNEAFFLGSTAIPQRFGNAYKRLWQRVPVETIEDFVAQGKTDTAEEYELRNTSIYVHDQLVQMLNSTPSFLSTAGPLVKPQAPNDPATVLLYSTLAVVADYCNYTFIALNYVRNVYTRVPSGTTDAQAYFTRAVQAYHADRLTCASLALKLADLYRAWSKTKYIQRSVSKEMLKAIADNLMSLAQSVLSIYAQFKGDLVPGLVQAEKICFYVILLELLDSDEFNIRGAAYEAFRDIPKPTPAQIKEFTYRFAFKVFAQEGIDYFNDNSNVAGASERYNLDEFKLQIIVGAMERMGFVVGGDASSSSSSSSSSEVVEE